MRVQIDLGVAQRRGNIQMSRHHQLAPVDRRFRVASGRYRANLTPGLWRDRHAPII